MTCSQRTSRSSQPFVYASIASISAPSGNSQCISGGARARHAASSVGPICAHIEPPCVLAWRPRAVGRNARPLPDEALAALPAVARDRDELVQRGLELLLAGAREPFAQDRENLRLRTPVDEDDEAETEPLLVRAVQPPELGEHLGVAF